jgi:putative transposase
MSDDSARRVERACRDVKRDEYNTVRLHASLQYVTPDDEHEGRGDAIRAKRRDGLAKARENRIAYRRINDGANPGENQ